ncbi:MAG: 6,7-dimethyl-8-ribityllumazine synthase [Gemmatimonadota bacterium]|nr:6,7-dimethyl-8-ribityllumazine synthase [Gemmatimonadota bacterium]
MKRLRSTRIGLLVARFNSLVTEQLLDGAKTRLLARGIPAEQILVDYVPGAWDLPQAARRMARSGRYDAIIAIGCVIRGETAHFDYVAGHASDGLGEVALSAGIPVVFGVLTTDNGQQAMARADTGGADKGGEFAEAALMLLDLYDAHPADGHL